MTATQEQILEVIQKHAQDSAAEITRDSRIEDVGMSAVSTNGTDLRL